MRINTQILPKINATGENRLGNKIVEGMSAMNTSSQEVIPDMPRWTNERWRTNPALGNVG